MFLSDRAVIQGQNYFLRRPPMAIEFYNVKKREKVQIDESKIEKKKYETKRGETTQVRYAFKAVDNDGTNLTKFCSEADWNKVNAPVAA